MRSEYVPHGFIAFSTKGNRGSCHYGLTIASWILEIILLSCDSRQTNSSRNCAGATLTSRKWEWLEPSRKDCASQCEKAHGQTQFQLEHGEQLTTRHKWSMGESICCWRRSEIIDTVVSVLSRVPYPYTGRPNRSPFSRVSFDHFLVAQFNGHDFRVRSNPAMWTAYSKSGWHIKMRMSTLFISISQPKHKLDCHCYWKELSCRNMSIQC
jgi:hypothetical protein